MRGREALVAVLVASLALPAWAGPTNAGAGAQTLGTLASGEVASIRNISAVPGTTIFSGDIVDVGAQGNAFIALLGGTQVVLGSESRARLAKAGNLVEVEVLRGRARFRSTEKAQVIGRLGDATLRASNGSAVGIISMVAANKAYIAAEKGELILQASYSAKNVTLREGEAVEVSLAPPPAAPPPPAAGLTGVQVTLIVVAITAVALGLGLKFAMDKDGLTDTQKRNLVSPFTFP